MEFISTIKNRWKFFLILSSFWCLFLVLSLNQNLNLTENTQNTEQEFANSTTNPNEKLQNSTQIYNTHVENPNISFNKLGKLMNKSINDQKKCNMFVGKWVYNPEEIVQYDYVSCPFVEEKMSCQKNGRPDSDYQKWRWEANDCDIPLFDGRDMLERLRNKRLIIAGDSMNRNMWESLACLLYSSIPSSRVEVDAKNLEYKVLKAKDYNAIIEFYWSPYLMEFDANHTSGKKVLIIDQVSNNSKHWKGADVMIFNSALWWPLRGQFKKWDLLQYKGQLLEDLPIDKAYEIGMKTWAKWIKQNVDPNTTKVFFRSLSALHSGKPYCYKATQPLKDGSSNKNNFPKSMINIIENIIKGMTNPQVKYLNITKLSEYRIDAHPSIYKSSQWKLHTEKNLIHTYADCNHWCLPGLPDTWNRLLYAALFFDMGL